MVFQIHQPPMSHSSQHLSGEQEVATCRTKWVPWQGRAALSSYMFIYTQTLRWTPTCSSRSQKLRDIFLQCSVFIFCYLYFHALFLLLSAVKMIKYLQSLHRPRQSVDIFYFKKNNDDYVLLQSTIQETQQCKPRNNLLLFLWLNTVEKSKSIFVKKERVFAIS